MIRNACQLLERGARLGRADRGLFHGKEKMYGNNVAYSNKRVRRSWSPNVFAKTFNSDLLKTKLRINVTSKALKCIDKAGSLDNYILFTKDSDLDSKAGLKLKAVMKKAWEKKYGTKFSARRITFERKIAVLLASGKITQQDYDKLFASGDGVALLPADLSPLSVQKLSNPTLAAAQAAAEAVASTEKLKDAPTAAPTAAV